MAWRIAVVTEDGTEKLEMPPEVLKEFIIKCVRISANGKAEFTPRDLVDAIDKGFQMADKYLRQETVRVK